MLLTVLATCSKISAAQELQDTLIPVEAFVPYLTPIGDVPRPTWPESFERDGIQGAVQMLVTIDISGRVVDVEALTGPAPMIDLAIAAVGTWRFNPVVREGHAVAAYTTALLTHYVPSRKPSLDDLKNRAALEREEALEDRFPRSNVQVLADLEQDSVGRTGSDRVERLTSLAKAAWWAGDTNKALSYTSELLARVSELRFTFEKDSAINNGNTILGLVALQQGDVDKANWYLLESAKVLSARAAFGPSMALADALLRRGQKASVLEYLSLCRTHWDGYYAENLDHWTKAIIADEAPDFGFDAKIVP